MTDFDWNKRDAARKLTPRPGMTSCRYAEADPFSQRGTGVTIRAVLGSDEVRSKRGERMQRSRAWLSIVLIGCAAGSLASSPCRGAAGQPELAAKEATRNRPLFSPTRRPPPPPPQIVVPEVQEAAPAPPPPPPRVLLSGVVIGSRKRLAIVTRLQDSKILSVEVGSEIEGWTVTSISSRAMTLKLGPQVVSVELPKAGSTPRVDVQ